MPKGYVIVRAEVTDPEKWAEYVAKSKVALEKFGGKPIVRGGQSKIVEGTGSRATWCSSSESTRRRSAMRTRPSTPRPRSCARAPANCTWSWSRACRHSPLHSGRGGPSMPHVPASDGRPPWRATVLTLFPEMFPGPLGHSLAGQALQAGIWSLATVAIREFGLGRHRAVDDAPAGGGAGMVMRADVLAAAIDHARSDAAEAPLLYLSPRGRAPRPGAGPRACRRSRRHAARRPLRGH